MSATRTLLVEDSEDDAALLLAELRRAGVETESARASTKAELQHELLAHPWDVVVVDWVVPGLPALEALRLIHEVDPDLPVILVSGVLREDDAVEALRSGAKDFVVKDRLSRLAPAIRREIDAARQRREERSLRARVAVVERLACVGVLARGLVHDLNGGLAVLSSNVEFALAVGAQAEGQEALRDARIAAGKLAETINSLRAFTSISEGASTLDVKRVLASAVKLVKTGVGVGGAELVVETADVPPINASEAKIVQLFYTLLLAAVGDASDVASRVFVNLAAHAGGVRVRIGPVVAPPANDGAALARTVRESLCRHLVADVGGDIAIDVDAAGATTWTVSLKAAVTQPHPEPAAAAGRPTDLSETRVLVIDDDPILCRTLARVLWPARAKIVGKASEALDAIAREGLFDVVLCDLMMEPIDGVRFLELLRRVSPEQASRLAFVTGAADQARIERQFPGIVVLQKPFDAAAVRDLVGAIAGADA